MNSWSFETMARTLWQEARGEPPAGQQAVAHVLLNRLRSQRWGKTHAAVCLAPLQFSGWNAHDPNRVSVAELPDDDPVLVQMRAVLLAAESEPDPTGGAMYYYAPALMKTPPAWVRSMKSCGKFGSQLFFKDAKK